MQNSSCFSNAYQGKTVLLTGHTGFKGSWLAIWLRELGAHVVGYSLPPVSKPSNFELSKLDRELVHIVGDIRDFRLLENSLQEHQPDIVFHLAAQAIVLDGYENPKDTFDINSGGTVNLLEVIRKCPSVKTAVIVTTDKCYENLIWDWGYRENDMLGGSDPYSASKSMAELAVAAYRKSFFSHSSNTYIASARAGNVIGGGDFSNFRIIPDCMHSLRHGEPIKVRNPDSVRPWLYVLDALSGYLWLGALLLEGGNPYADAWNFGPKEVKAISVRQIVEKTIDFWGEGTWENHSKDISKPEMGLLRLNWDKAANRLGWEPIYDWKQALNDTVDWTRCLQKEMDILEVCKSQIKIYTEYARRQNAPWAASHHHFPAARGL